MAIGEHKVEVALAAQAELGEGPVWDERSGELLFVDIDRRAVHTFDPVSGAHGSFDVGRSVGAVVLREDGGLVLAAHNAFFLADHDGAGLRRFGSFEVDDEHVRFNDGKVDPQGRFVAGTMHARESDARGVLYMLSGDGSVVPLVEGVTISNGLAWSRDGRTMYYIDTPAQTVDAFDVDPSSGSVSNRRVVAEIAVAGSGGPDGMAIDDEGLLWVAVWGGYRVDRVDPASGRLVASVSVPTRQVSSVAFGGASLDQLYITTARTSLDEATLAAEPHAGDVFVVEPGVSGPPAQRFALSSALAG
ncbi:MAG TPA: SMP-30/gluconolactonase/LRE family protein [Acidimicrobiales bacterium]|nr:SMP-30/gluconolactonase/LRE family protein [Acidimicrobiales bacterium]